jgi:hypothetical protein
MNDVVKLAAERLRHVGKDRIDQSDFLGLRADAAFMRRSLALP